MRKKEREKERVTMGSPNDGGFLQSLENPITSSTTFSSTLNLLRNYNNHILTPSGKIIIIN